MGLIRTVGDMVKTYFTLEEGMARIKTVMHGTAESVVRDMSIIKKQIMDLAVKTRIPIKELAETFYFLKTSSLSVNEAMGAFVPTINAMVATGTKGKEMARAVAGAYNTMGQYMDKNLSSAEKMTKIVDVLTYTYATQDVEMSELISGYTKLAPYLAGLEDNFTEVVTVLGFLNTRLLRAGRTGRLLGRSILQLTKNANNLASTFGITFDPTKPISLLKTINLIAQAMGKTGKITAEQGQALQDTFATRGAVPIRLLVSAIQDLGEAIQLAGDNVDGFAEKLAEIRMKTVIAQTARMKNIFAVLFDTFMSGKHQTGDLAEALQQINDTMEKARTTAWALGSAWGWMEENMSQSVLTWEALIKSGFRWNVYKDRLKAGKIGLVSITEFVERQEEVIRNREKEIELAGRIEEAEEGVVEAQKKRLINMRKMSDIFYKAEIDMLKVMGVSEYQRLLVQERQLQAQKGIMGETQRLLKLDKLRTQQAVALRSEKLKDLALIMKYEKGAISKKEVKRVLELKKMSPNILAGRYRISSEDKSLILKHTGEFTKEAMLSVANMARTLGNFFIESERMREFRGKHRAEPLAREARRGLGRMEYETPKLLTPTANIEMKTDIANIEIKLPEDSLDKLAEKVGNAVEEKLKTDESLQKFIAKMIRPYL